MHPEFQQIYWYSGVFLQPQHLQSIDLHHSYMLSRHRQTAQPWNMGILNCDYNPELLHDHYLKIDRLQAVMPSGEYLEYPGNCIIQPRQFQASWELSGKSITLWLALRRFDPNHSNVGNKPNSRWLVSSPEKEVMKDVYFDGPDCQISRILYNVQIIDDHEKEMIVDCEILPFLRLHYENHAVVADPTFCPPLISIHGSFIFQKILEEIHAILSSRAHQLKEYNRPNRLTKGKNNSDILLLLAGRSLNRVLPLLQHYSQTPGVHPWSVYGLLLQLAGDLSSLPVSGKVESTELTPLPYDHYQLHLCFNRLKNILIKQLNNITLTDNSWVTLHADEQNIFHGDMNSLLLKQSKSVLLLLQSSLMASTFHPDMLEFKIAPNSFISTLIRHALPGIATTWLNPIPPGIPDRKDAFYFELNPKDAMWEALMDQKQISFYWDGAPADLLVQVLTLEDE
jgi:type VI secretion system protein ImpJ